MKGAWYTVMKDNVTFVWCDRSGFCTEILVEVHLNLQEEWPQRNRHNQVGKASPANISVIIICYHHHLSINHHHHYLCQTKLPVGSFGCTGRVLFTSLNLPRAVWFIKHRSSLWGQGLYMVDFLPSATFFTPATYDINRRLSPCRQLWGRPRRPRPGNLASLEEVELSLFVCLFVVLWSCQLRYWWLCMVWVMRLFSTSVQIRTIVNPVMWDTVAVASGKIYKRGHFSTHKQVWNIVFLTQTVVKFERFNPVNCWKTKKVFYLANCW